MPLSVKSVSNTLISQYNHNFMTPEQKAILAILDMLENLLPSHATICDEIRYELTKPHVDEHPEHTMD